MTVSRAIAKRLARYPVHRLVPVQGLREHAAVAYYSGRPWEEFARHVQAAGIPTSRLSSGHRAAQVAFRAGHDDLLEAALATLERRYPEAAEIHGLWSDLHEYRGDYAAALECATLARLVQPTDAAAVARVVRLSYRVPPSSGRLTAGSAPLRPQAADVVDREHADATAIRAVRRFPLSVPVVSAVCRAAETAEQFDRIHQAWQEQVPDPAKLTRVVRQLAIGALRTGRIESASELYSNAITLVATGKATPSPITKPSLATRSAWTAIEDLCAAFDRAGIPFFFAAGTALGLVREGRPLPGDDDIDVGVFDADWDRDRITDLFVRDPRFTVNFHPDAPKIGITHRATSRVDIFRFHSEGAELWHDGVFVRWHNSPFSIAKRDLNGLAVPLPDDADRYLTENYGDWRTPNSGFDAFTDDAPNVKVTWPEHMQAHFLRRAYQKLVSRDHAGATVDLHRAGRAELAEVVAAGNAG